MSNMRNKLIELLENANYQCDNRDCDEDADGCEYHRYANCWAQFVADHLIANDVVPVVRCGNCCLTQHSPYALCVWCDKHHKTMKLTDFCSYGERKDNERKAD